MNIHFETKLQRVKADLYALRDEVVTAREKELSVYTAFPPVEGARMHPALYHLLNDIEQAISSVAEAQTDSREYTHA